MTWKLSWATHTTRNIECQILLFCRRAMMAAGGQRGWLLLQLCKKEVGDVATAAGEEAAQRVTNLTRAPCRRD
jgi:hypothetical protein